jgi:hypothetical protein
MDPPPPPRPPKRKNDRTRAQWDSIGRNIEGWATEKDGIDTFKKNLISSMSPAVLKKQQQLENNWEYFLEYQEPNLPADRFWHSDVVRWNVMHFLT